MHLNSSGLVQFEREQQQFLDGGARQFNLKSGGGFTAVMVVKFADAWGGRCVSVLVLLYY